METGPTTRTSTLNIQTAAASNSGVQVTHSSQPTKRELNSTPTCVSSDSSDDESDIEITGESTGNLDKTGALGALNDSHYEIINSSSGWLDCAKRKKKILYLPSAVFIAQRLVGPSKQLKQIIQI